MRIVLASQSPRRREMLALMGLSFETVVSDVDESAPEGLAPAALVCRLAYDKAKAVYEKRPNDCVIGADTVVYIDDKVIGKPKDDADARRILSFLQGRMHTVFTGVCVLAPGYAKTAHECTRVHFGPMNQGEIDWYVSTGEPRDKAGAYGIQGPGGMFVHAIEGNYFNVIGMPLPLLYRMLCEAGALRLA